MISELAARVFAARDIAHREHWHTASCAAHVALNAFYDGVIEAVDAVIESYQGTYGLIEPFEVETQPIDDILAYLSDEMDWIDTNRLELSGGSESIGSLIDVLTAVYSKTIFLLRMK